MGPLWGAYCRLLALLPERNRFCCRTVTLRAEASRNFVPEGAPFTTSRQSRPLAPSKSPPILTLKES